MISASEYERLKQAADEQAKQAERKRGELARVEAELKQEFGDGDPQEIMRGLEKKLSREEKHLASKLERFKRKHPGVVE
jgi:hypothetical protein